MVVAAGFAVAAGLPLPVDLALVLVFLCLRWCVIGFVVPAAAVAAGFAVVAAGLPAVTVVRLAMAGLAVAAVAADRVIVLVVAAGLVVAVAAGFVF